MWRRLNREELAAVNPLSIVSKGHSHTFTWIVYEEYEFKQSHGEPWPYFVAQEGAEERKVYEPLLDTPHLFLDFARLHERKDAAEATDAWFREYGLLGLHPSHPRRFRDTESWISPLEYDAMGGPVETADKLVYEAKLANHTLRLYEAALSRDEAKLEETIFDDDYRGKEDIRTLFNIRVRRTGGDRVDVLLDVAVQVLAIQVNEVLSAFAHPVTTFELSGQALTPEKTQNLGSLAASLWPRNLLGAMYLQFYWLITSSGDLSRCKQCGRFLSYAPPISTTGKSRKPRKDKEFCDSRCRQNYHYHARLRPARQGEKT